MGDLNIHDFNQFSGCSSFVGLGTGRRNGIDCALRHTFKSYHTIERNRQLFEDAARDNQHPDLTFWYGDTREVLRRLLPLPDKVLFWIDSHFPSGADFGLGQYSFTDDDLPLKKELVIISELQPSCCMIIDDVDMLIASNDWELPGAAVKLPKDYVFPGVQWIQDLFPHHDFRIDKRHQGFLVCSR